MIRNIGAASGLTRAGVCAAEFADGVTDDLAHTS
jgi:hypothetical protein